MSRTTLQQAGLFVTLRAYGNPDYRQYTDIADKAVVRVTSLRDAVRVCMDYIAENELGGGNWGTQSGCVFDSAKRPVARVSYNGRVWEPGDYPQKEIVV